MYPRLHQRWTAKREGKEGGSLNYYASAAGAGEPPKLESQKTNSPVGGDS